MKDGLTRHFAQTLSYTCSHAHYSNLTKGILVKPLCDELSGVLEHQVESRRTHVAIHHSRGQVEKQDKVPNNGTADGGSGSKQSSIRTAVSKRSIT